MSTDPRYFNDGHLRQEDPEYERGKRSEFRHYAVMRAFIVTANEDRSIPLNALIAARVDEHDDERQMANELVRQANAAHEMREALEWALDILDMTDAFLKEQVPETWAKLDRQADAVAKAKARAALRKATGEP